MLKVNSSVVEQPPALVIFDCDGVLVDTEGPSNRLLVDILKRHGLDLDAHTVARENTGTTMVDVQAWAEGLLGHALPSDFIDTDYTETFEMFREGIDAIPGVSDAIDIVQRAGLATCVASSGALEKMHLTLGMTGLHDRFRDRLFSAKQVARGKPHPDVFLFAASEMGFEPSDIVVVEDSVPGVTGAVAAGMRVLAYAAQGSSLCCVG